VIEEERTHLSPLRNSIYQKTSSLGWEGLNLQKAQVKTDIIFQSIRLFGINFLI
jgi:hypothetical protein